MLKISNEIKEAKHKDFFFAKFQLTNGTIRRSPVLVISNDNDDEDVIVCSCTSHPPRTDFDIEIQLKKKT